MSYLRYLCLFAYSGVQHILRFAKVFFLRLLCPMIQGSLNCPYFDGPFGILKPLLNKLEIKKMTKYIITLVSS